MTAEQERYLERLSEHGNLRDAADESGVSGTTLRQWFEDHEFSARHHAVTEAVLIRRSMTFEIYDDSRERPRLSTIEIYEYEPVAVDAVRRVVTEIAARHGWRIVQRLLKPTPYRSLKPIPSRIPRSEASHESR